MWLFFKEKNCTCVCVFVCVCGGGRKGIRSTHEPCAHVELRGQPVSPLTMLISGIKLMSSSWGPSSLIFWATNQVLNILLHFYLHWVCVCVCPLTLHSPHVCKSEDNFQDLVFELDLWLVMRFREVMEPLGDTALLEKAVTEGELWEFTSGFTSCSQLLVCS